MRSDETLFAVDVGNTRAKFGLFRIRADRTVEAIEIVACVLDSTRSLFDRFGIWQADLRTRFENLKAKRIVVAGSNPDRRDEMLAEWPSGDTPPLLVSSYLQIPISLDVEFPDRVGIDRLLSVYAARQYFARPTPVIVVDSGTATTVDLMTSEGTFRGGSILPGLRLSARAMHDYTARLPLIDVDETIEELPVLPGRNTQEAMLAGLFVGQLGAVREIAGRLQTAARNRYGETEAVQMLVTGGGGRQLAAHLDACRYVDSLALQGLALAGAHATTCR